MRGVLTKKTIALFAIASLDHDRYPGMKSQCLAGNPALVNCNLLDFNSLIYSEDIRQQALGLLSSTPMATANRVSDVQAQPPQTGCLQPRPSQTTTTPSPMDYPTPRGSLGSASQQQCALTCHAWGATLIIPMNPPASSYTKRLDVQYWQITAASAGKTSWRC